jgi:hypothetical protein
MALKVDLPDARGIASIPRTAGIPIENEKFDRFEELGAGCVFRLGHRQNPGGFGELFWLGAKGSASRRSLPTRAPQNATTMPRRTAH